jgi:PTH1 family peptidyl-tRNA hydrolase
MKLIVGLGNPGSEYERTRHNAGFLALDRVASRHAGSALPRSKFSGVVIEASLAGEKVVLFKPLNYMNRSGSPVAEMVNFYKLAPGDDLLVLVDDYALPLGSIRLRAEGSAGGHNGLSDIERALGTSKYPRLRIGVDPPPATYDDPADWVLGRFSREESSRLEPALDRTVEAVEVFVTKGIAAAMNRFNAREKPPTPPGPTGTTNTANAQPAPKAPLPPAPPAQGAGQT